MLTKDGLLELNLMCNGEISLGTREGGLGVSRRNGFLRCGVGNTPGFARLDPATNTMAGFDVEYCRAVAAAIFGDANKVAYTQVSSTDRFDQLASGVFDLLSRTTTWTLSRDTDLNIVFAPTTFYDGQGIMVRSSSAVYTIAELNGKSICTTQGTTTEINLATYFADKNLTYTEVAYVTADEVRNAFFSGLCDAYTADSSALAAVRAFEPKPEDYRILLETISKEPLAPSVRRGDEDFFAIVKWAIFAMDIAEELGVTSRNVGDMRDNSSEPAVRLLLGAEGDRGTMLGLSNSWAYDIIEQVGNYGEIFDRHLKPVGLERGLNAQWNAPVPGIRYAPPI